jgi:hypothetical protein
MYSFDGDRLGDATYPQQVNAGEFIHFGVARFEVLRLVEFDAADQSPFTGMLEVEPAP